MSEEQDLLREIQSREIPEHIAIIMDGNGRWAKKRGLARILGHRAGTESVRNVIKSCGELGVNALTLYAFSTENWVRPKSEVNGLMRLLCMMLRREVEDLGKNRVRLRAIGRIQELPDQVQKEVNEAVQKLDHNQGLVLTLALNYGGRQEIVDAVRKILRSGLKSVDEKTFRHYLYTDGLKDPDLVIRTSGEQRISNFLLYQIAYSEIYVTKTLWPDFRRKDLYLAMLDYQRRERRFGGT